jgi:tRNA nucleotidyltransferase (CCA-adding enzyme)
VSSSAIFSLQQRSLLNQIAQVSKSLQLPVYLVGGAVRDIALDFAPTDLDFVVEGSAAQFAEGLAKELRGKAQHYSAFQTSKVRLPDDMGGSGESIDFASCRSERYLAPGRLPEVSLGSIHEDMLRRDFRINALYVPVKSLAEIGGEITKEVFTNFAFGADGCRSDLSARLIEVFHDQSFLDDATRIVRAYRYRERIGGSFSEQVRSLIDQTASPDALSQMEGMRAVGEISRLLESQGGASSLVQMMKDQILQQLGIVSNVSAERLKTLLSFGKGDRLALDPKMQKTVLAQLLWNAYQESSRDCLSRDVWNHLLGISPKLERRFIRELPLLTSSESAIQLSDAATLLRALYCNP